ncbi:MAG: hypothetical protein GY826_15365, partial [Fuerstiella sp.]|nr:hypothetical protein [Fuerstiella sp.]
FESYAQKHGCNGIIGDLANYHALDADVMFTRMLQVAAGDVEALLDGKPAGGQQAGQDLW